MILVVFACKKVAQESETSSLPLGEPSQVQIGERDVFQVTKPWLLTFQSTLSSTVDNPNVSNDYTAEQMAAGVEALINVATTSDKVGLAFKQKRQKFVVNLASSGGALNTLYSNAYNSYKNFWLTTDTSQTFPKYVRVEVDSTYGTFARVLVVSTLGVRNTCLIGRYGSSPMTCNSPFSASEAYYVGIGDEELEIASIYQLPTDCTTGCGSIPPCEGGPTGALEAIEDHINQYYEQNPPSMPGKKFVGFANVECTWPNYLDFVYADCGITPHFVSGSCLTATTEGGNGYLDCIYCSVFNKIGQSPLTIPPGKVFVSLNLGTWFCPCGNQNDCDIHSRPVFILCYGTPIFKPLHPPGWDDPVFVDLDDLYIP
jgi:hypothetical protein